MRQHASAPVNAAAVDGGVILRRASAPVKKPCGCKACASKSSQSKPADSKSASSCSGCQQAAAPVQVRGLNMSSVPVRARAPAGTPLMIAGANDAAEHEADHVAAQVMSGAAQSPFGQMLRPRVQMKSAASGSGERAAPAIVQDVLRSGGVPLDRSTRAFMETRFGHDFSAVRVHADERAASSARAVNARAYTVGQNVVFAAGEHRPGTDGGKRLLAHELAHVVQQSGDRAPPRIQRTISVQNPADTTPPQTASNGAVVTGLFNGLCPDTTWQIDSAGHITPAMADFCSKGVAQSKMGTSCQCACSFTTAGGPDVSIAIDPTNDDTQFSSSSSGTGKSFDMRLRGKPATSITGATGAPVAAGESSRRTLQDPAWLILGHELCGHAQTSLPNISTPGRPSSIEHESTSKWDQSAVDVENKIRREHSTPSNDLGTRMGDYRDVEGNIHFGSVVQMPSSMTLITMMDALGVPTTSHLPRCPVEDWYHLCGVKAPIQGVHMLDRVSYRVDGNFNVAERCLTQSFAGGDFFAVEGVFWYLADGVQTKTQIAARYGVTMAALDKANKLFAPPVAAMAPDAKVAANTSVMVPYRLAPGSTRNFLTPGTGEC